ncbi:MAG TPA: hypothetical protein VMM92_12880, partial [Thermoanaerobaculia bacterium]|nr:hypothetical protein [Thermoanaerobaculia bacterium]
GPFNVHRAIISILAGHVFPRPAWALQWRMWAFEFFLFINRHFQIVPKRERFSLLRSDPLPPPTPAEAMPPYQHAAP